jgi:hypothetical protein
MAARRSTLLPLAVGAPRRRRGARGLIVFGGPVLGPLVVLVLVIRALVTVCARLPREERNREHAETARRRISFWEVGVARWREPSGPG